MKQRHHKLLKYLPSEFVADGISDETSTNPAKKSKNCCKRTSFNIQSSVEKTVENSEYKTKVEN